MTTGQREMLIAPGVVVAPQDAREGEPGQRFMTELRNDHADYSRILSLLSGQIERLPRMPRRTLPLLRDAFEFITAYIDASHHSREDVLYERLARRSRRSARILAHLRQEHSRGLLASRRISAEIAELTRAPHRARLAALGRAIDNFVEEAREHISREERIMYSQAIRALAATDWLAIERAAPKADPSAAFGRRSYTRRYPLLSRQLRGTGRRYVRGDADGVLQQLGVGKAGAVYGEVVGHGVGTLMLAQKQTREAISLAIRSVWALLTPGSPLAYAAVVRDTCRVGIGTVTRWAGHWRQHFGLAPTEPRPARRRTRRRRREFGLVP